MFFGKKHVRVRGAARNSIVCYELQSVTHAEARAQPMRPRRSPSLSPIAAAFLGEPAARLTRQTTATDVRRIGQELTVRAQATDHAVYIQTGEFRGAGVQVPRLILWKAADRDSTLLSTFPVDPPDDRPAPGGSALLPSGERFEARADNAKSHPGNRPDPRGRFPAGVRPQQTVDRDGLKWPEGIRLVRRGFCLAGRDSSTAQPRSSNLLAHFAAGVSRIGAIFQGLHLENSSPRAAFFPRKYRAQDRWG